MPSEPAAPASVESFISEAKRIFSQHCDPNNPADWLSVDDHRTAMRGLKLKGMESVGYLKRRIGKEAAAGLVFAIEARIQELLRWTELLVARGPDHRGHEDNLRCLRRDFETTDLPLLFENLRQAAGVAAPRIGKSTDQGDEASVQSYLNAKARLLAERETWRAPELPEPITTDILRLLDDLGWIEFRLWNLERLPPYELESPCEPRPHNGERAWFSPKKDGSMARSLEKVLAHNAGKPLLATEIRVTPTKRAELKVADEAAAQMPQVAGKPVGPAAKRERRATIRIDIKRQRVSCNGKTVQISGAEYQAFTRLHGAPGHEESYLALHNTIFAQDLPTLDHASDDLRPVISKLNKALRAADCACVVRANKRKKAYRLTPEK